MVDLSNAASGAISGAGIGSMFGPWGTAAGAAGGGILGAFGFGKGKKPKIKQMPNYTPEQLQMLDQIMEMAQQGNQSALEYINSILSDEEGAFADYERPFMEHFNETIVPSIMERFRGGGSRNSSGLQQSLAQGARGLSTSLAAQRGNLKQNALNALQGYNQLALQPRNTNYMTSGTPSVWDAMAPAVGNAWGEVMADSIRSNFSRQKPVA